jgi:hypothetical protein
MLKEKVSQLSENWLWDTKIKLTLVMSRIWNSNKTDSTTLKFLKLLNSWWNSKSCRSLL